MILIAHRGNFEGKDKEKENSYPYLINAIENGFDAELDIWFDDGLYLGHDKPTYRIQEPDLLKIQNNIWIHCKNLGAMRYFYDRPDFNYFWHQTDSFTLTSKGFVWTFPGGPLTDKSVCVLPESFDFQVTPYGVCSNDFRGLVCS